MFLSHIVVAFITVLNTNILVVHAQSTTTNETDEQCVIENEILFNDTKLNSLYPRNVSCQSSTDTYCAIDFDNVNGVDDYKRRCYELLGRIVLYKYGNNGQVGIVNECVDTTITQDFFFFTNDPLCLGTNCSDDFVLRQFPHSRLDDLGIDPPCGYGIGFLRSTSDANRRWTYIATSIVAVAVAVSLM
jgi:hypothetical protein